MQIEYIASLAENILSPLFLDLILLSFAKRLVVFARERETKFHEMSRTIWKGRGPITGWAAIIVAV